MNNYSGFVNTYIVVALFFQGFGDLRTLEMLLMCVGHHQYEVIKVGNNNRRNKKNTANSSSLTTAETHR